MKIVQLAEPQSHRSLAGRQFQPRLQPGHHFFEVVRIDLHRLPVAARRPPVGAAAEIPHQRDPERIVRRALARRLTLPSQTNVDMD